MRNRVDEYFSKNRIRKSADYNMILKSIAMLALYFIPYGLILSGMFSPWIMLALAAVMGFGMAGIGLSVMHDANHGAYSSNAKVNTVMGHALNLIGSSAFVWKIKHNVLHHAYTNIDGKDEDINTGGLMRFSPNSKMRYFHKYQHIYAWFFYGLMTLNWTANEDFTRLYRYNKKGLASNYNIRKEFMILILTKIIYFGYVLVLPFMVLNVAWWQILIGFFIMHYICSITLSLIFQAAHVVEGTAYPLPDNQGNIDNEWAIHQVKTTADFAKKNSLLSWYIGGLNFQVEHHLFPKICHVHYKRISGIVRKTAEEYRIRYNYYPSFISAIVSHARLLKRMGRESSLV